MVMPTAEQIVSRYLFNQDAPPANLKDDTLIRAAGAKGDPLEVDMNDFMTTGGGRFADVARFNFVRNFLAGNDYGATLAPGTYSTQSLLSAYGIYGDNQLLGIKQYYCGLNDADYVDRCYVFGSGNFKINDNAQFTISANGARTITNICVEPVNDNFDYESSDFLATITNILSENVVDPYQIGRQVPIEFTGSVTTRQNFTSADLALLNARNAAAIQAEEQAPAMLIANVSKYNGLFESLLKGLRDQGIISYLDGGNGRFVMYDGRDENHDGVVDAASFFIEEFWGFGTAIVGGGGNDHLFGLNGPDELYGGEGNDRLSGRLGDDRLEGGSGDDTLVGGTGSDTYIESSDGATDTILDDDGQGAIELDGVILTGGSAISYDLNGRPVSWKNSNLTYQRDRNDLLIIKNGHVELRIQQFDFERGALGITLDAPQQIILSEGTVYNIWATPGTTVDETSTIIEGASQLYTVSLVRGAQAGDQLTIQASGGCEIQDADSGQGAVGSYTFILDEGQTMVQFMLTAPNGIGAAQTGILTANYVPANGNASVTSNAIDLTLQTNGENGNLIKGDFKKLIEIDEYGNERYVLSPTGYAANGAQSNTEDILLGTAGDDSIYGEGGNDGITGGKGNDWLDGGNGDDLIYGGGGADTIHGGAGRDYIYAGHANGFNRPTNTDYVWTPPGGQPVVTHGFSWGIYEQDRCLAPHETMPFPGSGGPPQAKGNSSKESGACRSSRRRKEGVAKPKSCPLSD